MRRRRDDDERELEEVEVWPAPRDDPDEEPDEPWARLADEDAER